MRSAVFVMEQGAHYLDLDNKDQQAVHLICYHDDKLIAYCRLFDKGADYADAATFGRVLVTEPYRKLALGHELIDKAIDLSRSLFGNVELVISAQLYLDKFYESHGFVAEGQSYQDAGIAHIKMRYCKAGDQ